MNITEFRIINEEGTIYRYAINGFFVNSEKNLKK